MPIKLKVGDRVAAAGFAVSALFFLGYTCWFFNFVEDDAFIPMRYALNFWRGFGWVMNPGERVEGCTSPLQLALVTLVMRFAAPDTCLLVLKFLGLAIGLAVLRQTQFLIRTLFPDTPWLSGLAPVLIALRPDFAVSMINGLETGLADLLLTGGITAFVRASRRDTGDQRPAALWLLGAALARPELSLIFPLLLITSFRSMRPARLAWLAFFFYAGPFAAFLLTRYAFYDDLVPNTYWAKHLSFPQALPHGLTYLRDFAVPGNIWLASFLYLLGLYRVLRLNGPAKWALPIPLSIHAVFLLRSGGDWMSDGRFFIVMLPLCAAVWCAAFFQIVEMGVQITHCLPRMRAVALLSSFLLLMISAHLLAQDSQVRAGRLCLQPGIGSLAETLSSHAELEEWKVGNADGRLALGHWIMSHARPGQTVLTSEMGLATVINPQIKFLDMRGLTSRDIARMPGLPRDLSGVQGEREWMCLATPLGQYLHRRRPEWVALLWNVYRPDSDGITSANDLYAPYGVFVIHCDGRKLIVATWKRRDVVSPL